MFPEMGKKIDAMPQSDTSVYNLLRNTVQPVIEEKVVKDLSAKKFSLAIDEASDISNNEQLALIVRYEF